MHSFFRYQGLLKCFAQTNARFQVPLCQSRIPMCPKVFLFLLLEALFIDNAINLDFSKSVMRKRKKSISYYGTKLHLRRNVVIEQAAHIPAVHTYWCRREADDLGLGIIIQ